MEIFSKSPKPKGQFRESVRIPRYWKNKKTSVTVEVQRFLCIDGIRYQVIYLDPVSKLELSTSLEELRRDFEMVGNFSSKF